MRCVWHRRRSWRRGGRTRSGHGKQASEWGLSLARKGRGWAIIRSRSTSGRDSSRVDDQDQLSQPSRQPKATPGARMKDSEGRCLFHKQHNQQWPQRNRGIYPRPTKKSCFTYHQPKHDTNNSNFHNLGTAAMKMRNIPTTHQKVTLHALSTHTNSNCRKPT